MRATIHYSDDRTLYYITTDDLVNRPKIWLSTATVSGPVAEAPVMAFKGLIEFTVPSTGAVYSRTSLPFNFWKVNTALRLAEPIALEDDRYIDYFVASEWLHYQSVEYRERIQRRIAQVRHQIAAYQQQIGGWETEIQELEEKL